MRVMVDKDLCLGCGICEGLVPEVFSLEREPVAEVLLDPVPEEYWESVRQAVEDCPEGAITILEETPDEAAEAPSVEEVSGWVEPEAGEAIRKVEEIMMKVTVDKDLCIGCGICEGIVPEVFSLQNEPYAEVILDPVPEEFQEATREAKDECPEGAIAIEA